MAISTQAKDVGTVDMAIVGTGLPTQRGRFGIGRHALRKSCPKRFGSLGGTFDDSGASYQEKIDPFPANG